MMRTWRRIFPMLQPTAVRRVGRGKGQGNRIWDSEATFSPSLSPPLVFLERVREVVFAGKYAMQTPTPTLPRSTGGGGKRQMQLPWGVGISILAEVQTFSQEIGESAGPEPGRHFTKL